VDNFTRPAFPAYPTGASLCRSPLDRGVRQTPSGDTRAERTRGL